MTARVATPRPQQQFKRALDIFTKAFGPNHRFLATVLINQGHLFLHQRRYDEADEAYERALAINTATRGANHPEVGKSPQRSRAAEHCAGRPGRRHRLFAQGDGDRPRACRAGRYGRASTKRNGRPDRAACKLLRNPHRQSCGGSAARIEPPSALGEEAFEIAQWANQSAAAAAVQQLSPRFGARNDALAALVRQHQDLSAFWRDRDRALVLALSKPEGQSNAAQIDAIRRQIADTERKLAAVSAQLQTEYPDYSALANPKPLRIEDLQKLLGADEALIFLQTGDRESYVFALTRDGFEWRTIRGGRDDLSTKVAALRRGLDLNKMDELELDDAYQLYTLLLAPVEALVKDKGHLLIVPSGALTALPFHLLVTDKPAAPAGRDRGRLVPRCGMADQASRRQRSAFGGEPQSAAVAGAEDRGRETDDRVWRSGVQPGASPEATALCAHPGTHFDRTRNIGEAPVSIAPCLRKPCRRSPTPPTSS